MISTVANEIEKYLILFFGNQKYAIPVSMVLEILTPQSTTKIPSMPNYVKGVMNLRGKILPVIDLGKVFNFVSSSDSCCFVVIELNEDSITLICDEVFEVKEIENSKIKNENKSEKSDFINGIYSERGESLIFIDFSKVLKPIRELKGE